MRYLKILALPFVKVWHWANKVPTWVYLTISAVLIVVSLLAKTF